MLSKQIRTEEKYINKNQWNISNYFENFSFVIIIIAIGLYLYYFYVNNINKPAKHISITDIKTGEYDIPSQHKDGGTFPLIPGDISGGIQYANKEASPNSHKIHIESSGTGFQYKQIGIITRIRFIGSIDGELILPLMGRKLSIGLDKWQYYTILNSDGVNTRLPVHYSGKNCVKEHGCDYLNTGDIVYVEGYDDNFKVTIYENLNFTYIPYI